MFHPLLSDLSELKDADLELKISELGKKYSIAARSGNGGLCNQIALALEAYRTELQRRLLEKSNITLKNQNKDLDDLINVDR